LETPLGKRLLAGQIKDGDKVIVDWKDDQFTFETKGAEQQPEAVAAKV
jgi:hypothetical protein